MHRILFASPFRRCFCLWLVTWMVSKCRHSRSQSCPFCRDSLKRVNSGDLWVFLDSRDVIDMVAITRENLKRLFLYVEKLPLVVPDTLFDAYDTHVRWLTCIFAKGWVMFHSREIIILDQQIIVQNFRLATSVVHSTSDKNPALIYYWRRFKLRGRNREGKYIFYQKIVNSCTSWSLLIEAISEFLRQWWLK